MWSLIRASNHCIWRRASTFLDRRTSSFLKERLQYFLVGIFSFRGSDIGCQTKFPQRYHRDNVFRPRVGEKFCSLPLEPQLTRLGYWSELRRMLASGVGPLVRSHPNAPWSST